MPLWAIIIFHIKVRVTMADSNGHGGASATVEDVAAHFGVSIRTVRRWLKSTAIPHRRLGVTIRFNLNEVDEWASARTVTEPAA